MSARLNHLTRSSLQVLVGGAVGLLVLAVAHRLSHALSRAAVSRHLLELQGSWWQTRLAAWALVSVVAGLLIGILFRRRALVPALIAALVPPIFYLCTFIYLYPPDGLHLAQGYAFEAIVLLLVLPTTAYFVGRRYGG
jgi:ABC-type proline/glycine betaine transport system permease subunit